MAITIDGTGTISGLSSGGLPDNSVAPDDLTTGHPNWDSSGNVGIDKTPDSWASNYVGLQIGNTASIYGRSDTTNVIGVVSNAYYDGTSNKYIQNGNAERMYFNSGNIVFENAGSGTAGNSVTFSERMRIDSSGNLLVGTTSSYATAKMTVESTANHGMVSKQGTTGGYCFLSNALTNGGTFYHFNFTENGTQRGSITSNGSSTSYNTSSDYRLKEDVQPMSGSIDRVKALNPVNFAWKADGSRVDGFLAHEAATVVPEAVHGEKDAVDTDGNPEYQGIDQSKLVPLLTAALQEAITKIETLEARVATLESA